MPSHWKINPEWEYLGSEGAAEERACFAALSIYANGHCLTEGHDALANRLRKAPYLSAYHLAEWLAWNWWRLRWEPRTGAADWGLSHRLSSVGAGYIWPNISLSSDGERLLVMAEGTQEREGTPFRYIAHRVEALPASAFETGVDEFLSQVLERLDAEGLPHTNLHQVWADVQAERADATVAYGRKLEALLGMDPDEGDPQVFAQLLADASALGKEATEELAASMGTLGVAHGCWRSVAALQDWAMSKGRQTAANDRVRWTSASAPTAPRAQTPAWQLGVGAARALREQEHLSGQKSIPDTTLAALMGTDTQLLRPVSGDVPAFAFALDESERTGHIVLRSRWPTGRRFELARLLGDRLMPRGTNRLYPVTVAKTYQQQLQRAFAAELLCPFEAALDMLAGDYSEESQMGVAEHFQVSEMTVQTQLLNHGVLAQTAQEDERFALVA